MNHRQTTSPYSSKVLNKCLIKDEHLLQIFRWLTMELTAARRATPLTSKKVKRLMEALQEKNAPPLSPAQFGTISRQENVVFLRCPKLSGNDYLINLFANPPAPGTPDPPASRIMTSMFEKTQEPMSAGGGHTHHPVCAISLSLKCAT